MEKKLSHTDEQGNARMVDVGGKDIVQRVACATGFISLEQETLQLIRDNTVKKGDVLTVAEIAGIQAAKSTSGLIPLCHALPLDNIRVVALPTDNGIQISSEVRCTGKTGVEMEALTAVSIGLLTIYDMCKAVDKHMEIKGIRLIEKTKTPITV